MVKVEAVVVRERVETVIDAVEEETGHVGVTVVEAIGHGRERGVTHEYRGRTFESRLLPKALLTFVVEDPKSTRLNSSHPSIPYAVFCSKKKKRRRPDLHRADGRPSAAAAGRGRCPSLGGFPTLPLAAPLRPRPSCVDRRSPRPPPPRPV